MANITPHSSRPSLLFEDYETFGKEGNDIYWEFDNLVKSFIKDKDLTKYKIYEVEGLLTSVIYGISAELRLASNVAIRKQKNT